MINPRDMEKFLLQINVARYFTVEIVPMQKSQLHNFTINSHKLTQGILNAIQELHGDFGVAAIMSGFKAKYCNPVTRLGVIRTRHGPHRLVASCLPTIKSLQNQSVTVRTLYVGASLKQCFRFAVNYQKRELLKMWKSLPTDNTELALKKQIMDLTPFQEIESNLKIPPELSSDIS